MDPSLVIFAIEAGVRIGQRVNKVLVEDTHERPLVLPIGNLLASPVASDAHEYFALHSELTEGPGAPYRGYSKADKVKAYQTFRWVGREIGSAGLDPEAVTSEMIDEGRAFVVEIGRFEQFKRGFGAKPALRQLLGTLVEVGIDYFVAHPEALGKASPTRAVLSAFITHLDDVDFAEGASGQILEDVLLAALRTLDANVTLIDDDERLQVLVGGVTKALLEEVESSPSNATLFRRKDFVKRIASSVLRGGASAFSENLGLFLDEGTDANRIVDATLKQVLEGVRGKENLF